MDSLLQRIVPVVFVVAGLAGCIGKEADPRQVDEAVGDAIARDTTIGALEARVDSLERALAAVIEQYGRQEPVPVPTPDTAPKTGGPAQEDAPAAQPQPGGVPAPSGTPWPEKVTYETYRNDRLGYTIDYPANLMRPVEALGEGNGYRFATEDGTAVLAVYGVPDVKPDALKSLYEQELNSPDRRVTYKTLHDDWFVISGYAGDQIFYERTLQRDGVLKTFLLLYDASKKAYFDPITEHISFSFEG